MGNIKYRIDIDTGGTFTDGVLTTSDARIVAGKEFTTPRDNSIGVMNLFETLASKEKISLAKLLKNTTSVRYCSTQATNLLIERKGPKLGMITTRGFEDTLRIMRGVGRVDGLSEMEFKHLVRARRPEVFIPIELIKGVTERADCKGNIVIPLCEEEVKIQAESLLEQGIEGLVVCLLWGFNNTNEQRIRDIIKKELPAYSSIPITLSCEMSPKFRELPRMNTTVMNAYLKRDIETTTNGLKEKMKDKGYAGSLLLMQNFGGVATIANTRPLNTWNSGPVAGILGGLFFGELYGIKNAALIDTGGTSFDVSVIADKKYSITTEPLVERFRCQGYTISVKSVGAGGGSIAWINEITNRIEVGPQSAGANPGPACYGAGGEEPTVTDADVVLGVINPDYFHGGKMRLSKELATKALKEKIADPLGIDVVEAAKTVIKTVNGKMRNLVIREISEQGHDPAEFTLFAIGGMGATCCADLSADTNVRRIYTFLHSAVFSALGASISDIVHQYAMSRRIGQLMNTQGGYCANAQDHALFNSTFEDLEKRAASDILAAGFETDQIEYVHELEMKYGTQLSEILITSPVARLNNEDDARSVCDAFVENYDLTYGEVASYKKGGIDIESFILRAILDIPKPRFKKHKKKSVTPPAKARKGKRKVFFVEEDRWIKTRIYDREKLKAGNVIEGPAILESVDTTYQVPVGWTFRIDEFLNGVFERN